MSFDPLSWAIGFALTKSVGALSSTLLGESLETKLDDAMRAWARSLPPEAWLDHSALAATIIPDSELSTRPALAALRSQLRRKVVPSERLWEGALLEHWDERRLALGRDAQPFFLLDREEAAGHLRRLSAAIRDVCISHEPLFKGTVLSHLAQLLASGLRPGAMGLPEPLTGPFQAREVAQAVEAETGSHIHAVVLSENGKKLWLWGRFFGRSWREQQGILAGTARLVSAFPDIDRLFLGFSLAADLPGTDGKGVVGLLIVEMTRSKLDILATTGEVPPNFWDDLQAFVCAPEQVPFERWDPAPFREIAEKLR